MARSLLVAPAAEGVGLARTCLGLLRALDRRGVKVAFVKPVAQPRADGGPDRSTARVTGIMALRPPEPLTTAELEQQLGEGGLDVVLEKIVAAWEPTYDESDVVVVEGLSARPSKLYASSLNQALARALDADVVLADTWPADADVDGVAEQLAIAASGYVSGEQARVVGCVVHGLPGADAAAFRYQLVELARAADALVVLPEGTEPRTMQAAVACAERGIARCLLLGAADEVAVQARHLGLRLPGGVTIVDSRAVAERYVAPLAELRRHKGWTEEVAREHLADPITVGTMMLRQGEVDGLVCGSAHTTAATVRPALQILGTKPGSRLVSSIFFMCLPDQVVIYGDCAINPQPSAEDLADIAIQSAASARTFGIEPRVAMISFSTGGSGTGTDVDKVAEATRVVREREPSLAVDGPMQYDAAAIASVGQAKRPGSRVAGRATVFIFPDLDAGNTTYKAVQRSAQVVSIGPMLQGLAKPVNDLSRGALVDDIIYTIALTAIQARAESQRG